MLSDLDLQHDYRSGRDALLAIDDQTVDLRPADQDRSRSQRHHLHDVEARANTAVGEHRDLVADRIRDSRQRPRRRVAAIRPAVRCSRHSDR